MASPGKTKWSLAPMRQLSTEVVEFSVVRAADECLPFAWGEAEHRARGVPRVAHADPAVRQAGHLDAVRVRETQGTLDPGQARVKRPFRTVPQLRTCHVLT